MAGSGLRLARLLAHGPLFGPGGLFFEIQEKQGQCDPRRGRVSTPRFFAFCGWRRRSGCHAGRCRRLHRHGH
jgi:hypothetical protein